MDVNATLLILFVVSMIDMNLQASEAFGVFDGFILAITTLGRRICMMLGAIL